MSREKLEELKYNPKKIWVKKRIVCEELERFAKRGKNNHINVRVEIYCPRYIAHDTIGVCNAGNGDCPLHHDCTRKVLLKIFGSGRDHNFSVKAVPEMTPIK